MKFYSVVFGNGNPLGFTGLAPTFLSFYNLATGTTNAPPSIAETIAGKTGIYTFQYGVTQPICFLLDAATTSPGANGRYVTGQIDPADRIDEYGNTLIAMGTSAAALGSTLLSTLNALGSTLSGIGNTSGNLAALVGNTSSIFGSTLADPTTLFGYLKRSQEIQEGNNVYTKATGIFQFYSRGSSTLLTNKTISDSSSTTTKT